MATRKLKSVSAIMPTMDPVESRIPAGFDQIPTPIVVYTPHDQFLWANEIFTHRFGPIENQSFQQIAQVVPLQGRPVTLQTLTQPGRHEGFAMDAIDEKSVPIELRISELNLVPQPTFLVLFEEVGVRFELQQQLIQTHLELQKNQAALIQSSKLASLGELSSGIAHELNQPLQAILGFSQELIDTEKLTKNGKEFLQDIHHAAQKMRDIIRSLRTFARDAGSALTPISVEHSIFEAKRLVHHQLMEKGIELDINIEPNLPMVDANAIQLEQVLINLISNARDAIEVTQRKDGKIEIIANTIKSGKSKQVQIQVRDNGCGMGPETKTKIFDPFFTTKEVGKGTGLGLSISYGILKRFEVETKVDSTPNHGTRFTLTFPTPRRKP